VLTKRILYDACSTGKGIAKQAIPLGLAGGQQKSKVVLTGSQNLDVWSLKTNDECQMEIRNDDIFEQYLNFWSTVLIDAQQGGLRVFDEADIETKLQ
jgi:hypothetical protein